MKKPAQEMKAIFKYGAFSLPIVNFLVCEGNLSKDWKEFVCVLKYAWNGNFKRAIQRTDKAMKSCRLRTVKYLLLANKLSFLKNTGQLDLELYKYLKHNLSKMPRSVRDDVISVLMSVEASGLKVSRKIRLWKSRYKIDEETLSFLYLAQARREASRENLSKAVHNYIQAYRMAKSNPHPTGVIASLNDFAWDVKERHPKIAHDLSQKAVFWLGYYKEAPGNLFGALDTLFVIEKNINSLFIYNTARVISSLPVPEHYVPLLKEAKKFVVDYTKSSYLNTAQLRNYIEKVAQNEKNLSPKGISDILKGKTKTIRGNTIRKILTHVDEKIPFPIWNERVKVDIERRFNIFSEKLGKFSFHKRLLLFLSTYTALVDRNYLSGEEKLEGAYKSLKDIEIFKNHMLKRYETMEFVISMVEAHPYIEGRKEIVKRALERMSERKLERFIQKYIELKEGDRKLLDKFLRNYGRYDGVRFEIRLKGPDIMREFAKKYSLKVQPSFIAFWCEEDGRVRRKLERILRALV